MRLLPYLLAQASSRRTEIEDDALEVVIDYRAMTKAEELAEAEPEARGAGPAAA